MRKLLLLLRYLGLFIISLPVLGFCALMAYLNFGDTATLTISNASPEIVSNLTIKSTRDTFALGDLAPGQSRTVTTKNVGRVWQVNGHWPDGTKFDQSYGYFEAEISQSDTLTIRPDRTFVYVYKNTSLFGVP